MAENPIEVETLTHTAAQRWNVPGRRIAGAWT
jgi:hypothetical protein